MIRTTIRTAVAQRTVRVRTATATMTTGRTAAGTRIMIVTTIETPVIRTIVARIQTITGIGTITTTAIPTVVTTTVTPVTAGIIVVTRTMTGTITVQTTIAQTTIG